MVYNALRALKVIAIIILVVRKQTAETMEELVPGAL